MRRSSSSVVTATRSGPDSDCPRWWGSIFFPRSVPPGRLRPHHHRGTPALYEGRLIVECDELWSFVGSKRRQKWIWLAINRDTREIVGMAIGARTKASACRLWRSLPAVYRHCAVCYSDFWEPYAAILPSKRHRAVGKESGQTNDIERFNNTL